MSRFLPDQNATMVAAIRVIILTHRRLYYFRICGVEQTSEIFNSFKGCCRMYGVDLKFSLLSIAVEIAVITTSMKMIVLIK